jgi:hypothetical protein
MNIEIAEILKGYLTGASFVDKLAGLVQTMRIGITDDKGARVETIYPVSCLYTFDECKTGKYAELVPNSKYSSILYFEDNGITFGDKVGRWQDVESKLKLVCWANMKKLNKADYNSANMIAEILYLFPDMPIQTTVFKNLSIRVTGQDIRNSAIFGKYRYNEPLTQYLMYPFDYFALNISVSYKIIPKCYEPNDNPAPNCP